MTQDTHEGHAYDAGTFFMFLLKTKCFVFSLHIPVKIRLSQLCSVCFVFIQSHVPLSSFPPLISCHGY